MKKILSITVFVALIIACLLPAAATSPAISYVPNVQLQVLSDVKNGEQVNYEVVSASTQEIDENQYTSSYEIFVPIDDPSIIQPFSSLEQNKNDNGIIATLKITYFLRNNGQEIKLTNISGSWKSSSTSISIETKDREVAITDGSGVGGVGSKTLRWYPSSNTFSYNTGWDYVAYMPHIIEAMTGPRGFSEIYYRITGMGSTWQHLYFQLEVK